MNFMILAWSGIFIQVAVTYFSWFFLQKSWHYTGILGVNLFLENPGWTFLKILGEHACQKLLIPPPPPNLVQFWEGSVRLGILSSYKIHYYILESQLPKEVTVLLPEISVRHTDKQIAQACCYVLWRFSLFLWSVAIVNPVSVLSSNFHTAAYKMIFKTIILMSLTLLYCMYMRLLQVFITNIN